MQKNTVINTGSVKFTFTDNDGETFAWLKLNPTDPRMLKKCKTMMDFSVEALKDITSLSQREEIVESQFCEFLGYDCRQSLFGRIAATDIMADGRIFAAHVLDVVAANIGPEIRKRREAQKARYTAKYK